ncbi:MAG: hypothetical protein IJD21_06510 [Oscillospiraceae bacterium]|nr:hypothetical protein [Oscillospiraceae bacterium]
MNQKRWRRDILLSVLVPGALLLLGLLTVRFSYEVNDDTAMISIMNGSFTGTPSPYAIFVKYPLSWLISLFYRTGLAISWYQVIMFAIMWLAMGSVLYRLLQRLPEHPVLASLMVTGSVSVLWMTNIMRFTFSTCGAFVAASALICFSLQKKEEDLRPAYLVNIILLYVLSYLIRDYFCYVATCFLGVIWLAKYGREMFANRKCWRIPVAALLCMAIAMGINSAAYHRDNWDWFIDYNNARSNLQDFLGFPDYDDHKQFINELGYDRQEYYAISHYDYCLLEDFSPEDLFPLSDYADELMPEVGLKKTVKTTVKRAIDYFFVDSLEDLKPLQLASYLLPPALLMMAVICSLRDKKWYILPTGLLLFGLGAIWLYIALEGRYPLRVASTMRIITIAASLSGIAHIWVARLEEGRQSKKQANSLAIGLLCGLFALCALLGLYNARNELGAPLSQEVQPAEYVSYVTEHPENIYLRDTRSVSSSSALLSEFPRTPVNMVATGSWTAYSPIFYEKLETLGLDGLNRETLYLDNCYLIVHQKHALSKVLGVSGEAVIEAEVVEAFDDGMQIWKIHSITE